MQIKFTLSLWEFSHQHQMASLSTVLGAHIGRRLSQVSWLEKRFMNLSHSELLTVLFMFSSPKNLLHSRSLSQSPSF